MLIIKNLIERFKFRRVKEIIIIDSENVGYSLPLEIPKEVFIYLFISDQFIFPKIKDYQNHKQICLIDILKIRKENVSKNIMDFCIVTKLTELITKFSS